MPRSSLVEHPAGTIVNLKQLDLDGRAHTTENIVTDVIAGFPEVTDPAWMTAGDVSKLLKVSIKTVNRWVLTEGMPALRIGKVTRFERAAVDRWLARQQQARGKRPALTPASA